MLRLSSLKPEGSRYYRDREKTADLGGFPTNEYDLSFVCPACGFPFVIGIRVGPEVKDKPVRCWRYNIEPYSTSDWMERFTLQPSIDNTKAGHGRKHPNCGFHGSIVNGEIVPS